MIYQTVGANAVPTVLRDVDDVIIVIAGLTRNLFGKVSIGDSGSEAGMTV